MPTISRFEPNFSRTPPPAAREDRVTAPVRSEWGHLVWAQDSLDTPREFRCDCGAQVRAFRPPVGVRCAVCQWIADAAPGDRADLRLALEGAR